MLPDELKKQIEVDYGMEITEVKYLSQGSNGSVCRVSDSDGNFLCVKIVPKGNASSIEDFKSAKAMFDSEYFAVRSYENQCPSNNFIAMPFFKGEDLSIIIKKNLPLDQREIIFAQLIIKVEEMHAKGVLHRDLKAENIIVSLGQCIDDTLVNIIDFGRSVRIFDHETGKASATPEQLSLKSTNTAWYSVFFITQLFRKWQTQTAPEYTSVLSDYYNHEQEAAGVGLRSDYYAIANLFQALIPEHKDMVNKILFSEGLDRTRAYRKFVYKFVESLKLGVSYEELPYLFEENQKFTFFNTPRGSAISRGEVSPRSPSDNDECTISATATANEGAISEVTANTVNNPHAMVSTIENIIDDEDRSIVILDAEIDMMLKGAINAPTFR